MSDGSIAGSVPAAPCAVAGIRAAHTASGILEIMTGEIPGWARRDDPYPRADRLALYVDFENLVLGAGGSLPGRADPVPDSALTWLCRDYGTTSICRAYADWADPRFRSYQ